MTTTVTATAPAAPQHPAVTRRGSHVGPVLGAVSLVVGAGLNTAQAVLSMIIDRPSELADQIAYANDHPALWATVCIVGTLAVPFMAIGFIAVCQELATRSRKVAMAAGTLLVLGMWGFLTVQVSELIQFTAMTDPAGQAAATYMDTLDENVLLAAMFGVPFFAGTVLGMLVLTIALLARGGLPRWIPGAWLLFIVLDFSIGSVGPVDPHWLYLAGAMGAAAHLVRGRATARP